MANSTGFDVVAVTMTGTPVALNVPTGIKSIVIQPGVAAVLWQDYDDGVAANAVGLTIPVGGSLVIESTNAANRRFYLTATASTVNVLYEYN